MQRWVLDLPSGFLVRAEVRGLSAVLCLRERTRAGDELVKEVDLADLSDAALDEGLQAQIPAVDARVQLRAQTDQVNRRLLDGAASG